MAQTKNHRFFYVIPANFERSFSPIKLLRAIKSRTLKNHINNHWLCRHKPIGGVKVGLQHCLLLNELGYEAYPLCLGNYQGNFFQYDLEFKNYDSIAGTITEDDIVVIPEYLPYLSELFPKSRKVIFVQNWRPLYNPAEGDKSFSSYKSLGFEAVFCCGDYLYSLLRKEDLAISSLIKNFIDFEQFKPAAEKREAGRILALPRKNPMDLEAIESILRPHGVKIHHADGLTENQLISEFQKTDIFLATGYPEGFGLPPLEAMACGCAVVGFTGRGADEYMKQDQTALVASDGDVKAAAAHLLELLNNIPLRERLRESAAKVVTNYSKEQTRDQLQVAVNKLGGI